MVALVYTFDPPPPKKKNIAGRGGRGAGDLIASAVQWKEKSP